MPTRRSQKKKAPTESQRLPRFSPSRIKLYLFCPRAYHFYYDRGLRWGGMTAGHAFGGHLHRVLQSFHAAGGASSVPWEELLSDFHHRWPESGFATTEEAEAHRAAGEELLRRHYEQTPEPGRETLWTEKTVSWRYPEFVLFGKIDRLDRRPDGALEIIDYKSGRHTVSEAEVREDLALMIYQLLVARAHPGTPVHAGILCLRSGDSAFVLRSEAELDTVEQGITSLVRRILQDEQMPPLPEAQCRDCVYPRICPPGRYWLATHPEPSPARNPK